MQGDPPRAPLPLPLPATGAGAGAGVVELREDVPLNAGKGRGGGGAGAGAGARWCGGGPRLILACFGALSAAITLALFTQIYYGDYEVVPHGSVASSAAACSRAGTDALKAGGRALDAAAAAALCLAVVAPHITSLDASGSLVYWEYRQLRTQQPSLAEWGGAGAGGAAAGGRPPRLVAALAALHAEGGALPWPRLLQPAIDLARNGFPVSASLSTALAALASSGVAQARAPPPAGALSTAPQVAAYLESLQLNTSAELSRAWGPHVVRRSTPAVGAAGAVRVWAGGARAARTLRALALALASPPKDLDDAQQRVVGALVAESAQEAGADAPGGAPDGGGGGGGVATGLAVVDQMDTYVALVTGLSVPFGSGGAAAGAEAGAGAGAGWTRDELSRELDLAPAIMVDEHVCGKRYVLGAESSAALAQVCAALAAGGGAASVERARVLFPLNGGPPAPESPGPAAPAAPAVNLVQQAADALLSHADSRGGGLASRF